jgi:hypothetical protein
MTGPRLNHLPIILLFALKATIAWAALASGGLSALAQSAAVIIAIAKMDIGTPRSSANRKRHEIGEYINYVRDTIAEDMRRSYFNNCQHHQMNKKNKCFLKSKLSC